MSDVQTTNNQVRPILPYDMESAWRMATAIAKSGLAPKGIQTTEAIFTAMQMGAEVGLSPMQALQNIAVVNGRPTIWGDAQLGLVRGSGLLESFEEKIEGEGDNKTAYCIVKRKGDPVAITGKFSIAEAKVAQLWGKAGPWSQYPERMLKMRARGFALRDGFSDILKGLYSYEEAIGMQDVTPVKTQSVADKLNAQFLKPKEEVIPADPQATEVYSFEEPTIDEPPATEQYAYNSQLPQISIPSKEDGLTADWEAFTDKFINAAYQAPNLEWLRKLKKQHESAVNNLQKSNKELHTKLINTIAVKEEGLRA